MKKVLFNNLPAGAEFIIGDENVSGDFATVYVKLDREYPLKNGAVANCLIKNTATLAEAFGGKVIRLK